MWYTPDFTFVRETTNSQLLIMASFQIEAVDVTGNFMFTLYEDSSNVGRNKV
jgi:hypothetical protein